MARATLLGEGLSNGTGTTYDWDGGEGVLYASGTWDGASVTLQYSPADPNSGLTLTPQDTDVVLTSGEPQQGFYKLPVGQVRVVVAGGGGSEDLTVVIGRSK